MERPRREERFDDKVRQIILYLAVLAPTWRLAADGPKFLELSLNNIKDIHIEKHVVWLG